MGPGEGRPLGQSGACEELGLRPEGHAHPEPTTLRQGTRTPPLPGKHLTLLIAHDCTGVSRSRRRPRKALETHLDVPGSPPPPPLRWLSREKADRQLPWAPLANKAPSRPGCLPGHMAQRGAPPPSQGEGLLCRAPPAGPSSSAPRTGDWCALPPPCEVPPVTLLPVYLVMVHTHDLCHPHLDSTGVMNKANVHP